jgi:hypothetical protein
MRYVCDAPGGRTWFRIETQEEASQESALMRHSLERQFCAEMDKARQSFRPPSSVFFEQEIGLKAHLQREMAMFLTLRDDFGVPLATAMLPPSGRPSHAFKTVILGRSNLDPYMKYADCIFALGKHFGLSLDRPRCYPFPPGRH